MATYEFDSLEQLAQWLLVRGDNLSNQSRTARLARDRNDAESRSKAFYDAANIVRNSVIKQATPVNYVRLTEPSDPAVEAAALKAYKTYTSSWQGGAYVQAIKAVRAMTGLSLREAKDWCDARRSQWDAQSC